MRKSITALLVILIVAINGNTMEYLIEKGYPASLLLSFSGILSFAFNSTICTFKRHSLLPQKWKYQILRLINNGVSMLFILESYKYLSAGSVVLVQRTDIPFLILISIFTGERRNAMQSWLSVWSILMVVFLIIDSHFINEDPKGFLYAFAGIILISFSYLLVAKSVVYETPYVISNVNSLGYTIIGTAIMIINEHSWHIEVQDLWAFLLLGILLSLIYIIALPLYKWFRAERARFPFILGALATMLLEMIIEKRIYSASHIALVLLISGMIATISLNMKTPHFYITYLSKIKLKISNREDI